MIHELTCYWGLMDRYFCTLMVLLDTSLSVVLLRYNTTV